MSDGWETTERSDDSGWDGGGNTYRLPLKAGAIRGLVAFVVGLWIVGLLQVLELLLAGMYSGFESMLYGTGWLFLSGHLVDISVSVTGAGAGGTIDFLDLFGSESLFPTAVYYAIPPAVLFLAGRATARTYGSDRLSTEQLALTGATIAGGYLPAALVGSLLLARTEEYLGATVTVGPDPVSAVLFAGIGYPLLFGGLGGSLSG